jgi:hypothetical protein
MPPMGQTASVGRLHPTQIAGVVLARRAPALDFGAHSTHGV